MRQFYLSFPNWNTVCSELSWSHYRALIKIEEQHIRDFYMEEEINGNPTIGLLLVTEQDTLVAKYSSIYKDQNIFVSKYMTCMPTEEELKRVINEEKRLIEEYKIANK